MSLTKATYSMISGSEKNILDFGADPTGVNNSSPAIQAALDLQGSIYIPDGTYKIMSDLIIRTNTLVQFGSKAVFMAGANNVTFFKSTVLIPAYFSQIYNAQFDGNGFTNVTGFDLYNFRLNSGLFNPNMTRMEVGIILRYGCFDTLIFNPTTFNNIPYPIRIMDNSGGVQIINPTFENTGNPVGTSIGIDIQVGATIGQNIGCIVYGGYCQGFNIGISDTGLGTKIHGTYFENGGAADVLADGAINSIYIGTEHWAPVGSVAIKGTGSDGVTIISPLMGSGNRSTGLLDFDGTNTNCLFINSGSATFKNNPLGVTTGVSFSISQNNLAAEVITATKGYLSLLGSVTAVTATPTTLFTVSGANRGRYEVVSMIANSGTVAAFTALATVIWDGSQARIVADNGGQMTLTVSGGDVQVTQTAGSNQTVYWSYTYQPI